MPPLPPAPGPGTSTETLKCWIQSKIERDRRSQEEEKTRQEAMKLERRKVEHAILVDGLRAGVPPHLLPLLIEGAHVSTEGNQNSTPNMVDYVAELLRNLPAYLHQQPLGRPIPIQPVTLPSLSQQFCAPPVVGPPRQMRNVHSNIPALSTGNRTPSKSDGSLQMQAGSLSIGSGGQGPLAATVSSSTLGPTIDRPGPMDMFIPNRSSIQSHSTPLFGAAQPPANVPHGQQQSQHGSTSAASIAFYQWVPPGQAQSQISARRAHEGNMGRSNPAHPEIQGSPSLKRKSRSMHHQLPPPYSRPPATVERRSQAASQSPAGSLCSRSSAKKEPQGRSHTSSPRQPPATGKGHGVITRTANRSPSVAKSMHANEIVSHERRRVSAGSTSFEEEKRGTEPLNQKSAIVQVPVAEDTGQSPSPTGNVTRSSAVAGSDDRE